MSDVIQRILTTRAEPNPETEIKVNKAGLLYLLFPIPHNSEELLRRLAISATVDDSIEFPLIGLGMTQKGSKGKSFYARSVEVEAGEHPIKLDGIKGMGLTPFDFYVFWSERKVTTIPDFIISEIPKEKPPLTPTPDDSPDPNWINPASIEAQQ